MSIWDLTTADAHTVLQSNRSRGDPKPGFSLVRQVAMVLDWIVLILYDTGCGVSPSDVGGLHDKRLVQQILIKQTALRMSRKLPGEVSLSNAFAAVCRILVRLCRREVVPVRKHFGQTRAPPGEGPPRSTRLLRGRSVRQVSARLAKVAKRTLRIISTSSQKSPAASASRGALFRTLRLGEALPGMVARKARGAKKFQSVNLIQRRWNNLRG